MPKKDILARLNKNTFNYGKVTAIDYHKYFRLARNVQRIARWRRERNANSDTLSSLSAVVNPGARRDSTRWFFFFFPLHEQYTPWRRQVEMDTATIRCKRWKKDGARAGKGWQTNVISRGGDSAGCLHAKYESVAHLHRFI